MAAELRRGTGPKSAVDRKARPDGQDAWRFRKDAQELDGSARAALHKDRPRGPAGPLRRHEVAAERQQDEPDRRAETPDDLIQPPPNADAQGGNLGVARRRSNKAPVL